jgi:hypothetical protein
MKNNIGFTLIAIFSLTIVFHLFVLLGFVPIQYIWGGRLNSKEELYVFETVSVVLNALFIFVIYLKTKGSASIKSKILNSIIWVMTCIFALNTLGNLFAINSVEKLIFTPLTFLISILLISFQLVKKKPTADI